MSAVLSHMALTRRRVVLGGRAAFVFLAVLLSGCNAPNFGIRRRFERGANAGGPNRPLPGAVGDAFGARPVRVGAVLPLTQSGSSSLIGQSLRNAAQLAVEESGAKDITLMIEDDRATPEGAAQAAQAELGAGAEIIVGPLFAADVRAVGDAAKAANKPGDCVLDRYDGGRRRRLFAFVPHRVLRRQGHGICRLQRQEVLRGARAPQRLRQRRGRGSASRSRQVARQARDGRAVFAGATRAWRSRARHGDGSDRCCVDCRASGRNGGRQRGVDDGPE